MSDLRALSETIAGQLDVLLAPGEAVALLAGNDGESVGLLFAVLTGNRTAVLLPRAASLQELQLVLDQSKVRLLALQSSPGSRDLAQALSSWRWHEERGVAFLYKRAPDGPSPLAVLGGKPHVGQLTSGSTGASLLALRSLDSVHAEARAVAQALRLGPNDRLLCASSIAHSYACVGGFFGSLQSGAQLALAGSPDDAADLIHEFHPTIVFGLASTYSSLLRRGDRSGLAELRLALSAGAPLPAGLYEAFLHWSGIPIRQDYGTTETGTISLDVSGDPDPSTVGRPLPDLELRLAPIPDKGKSEVQVRSPGIARWYLTDGQLVPCADRDGWYHTGDLGAVDQRGMLRLEGRLRLSIKAHGTTLDPDAIEIAMLTCPGLQDVAVVPLPGPGGAILLKAVAVAPGLSAEQLRRWFAENLPPLFQPDMIELRESLPYSPAGKLLRKHLV